MGRYTPEIPKRSLNATAKGEIQRATYVHKQNLTISDHARIENLKNPLTRPNRLNSLLTDQDRRGLVTMVTPKQMGIPLCNPAH